MSQDGWRIVAAHEGQGIAPASETPSGPHGVRIAKRGDVKWAKIVRKIDRSKRGGYALAGPWIEDGQTDVQPGTVIVYCYVGGSRRRPVRLYYVVVVEDGVLRERCLNDLDLDALDLIESLIPEQQERPDEVANPRLADLAILARMVMAMDEEDPARAGASDAVRRLAEALSISTDALRGAVTARI